jgi:formylglycine-generating enzyme required for sulfatase activity
MLTRFKKVTGLSKTRLPSIPEWQYAYRAGTTTEYYSSPVSEIATYAAAELSDVGSHKPNAWGLYDMSGNVGELTSGYWSGTYASWQISCGGTYREQESGCKVTSTGWVDYGLNLSDSSHYCFNAFRIFVEE